MTKYGLNIVFYMKSYPQFQLKGRISEFEYDDLKFRLTKLSDVDNSYSLIIKPVENMEHARYVLNKIKLALILIVLDDSKFTAIEIDETIKKAHMYEDPILVENDCLVYGKFNTSETTLFPLGLNLEHDNSAFAEVITIIKIDKLVDNIEKACSLNHEKIYADEKLVLALEMYTKHSQFSRKRQFLDLVTILEILKPEYPVSDESLKAILTIKNEIKNIRKRFEKDSEEYNEFGRYFNDLKYWQMKSINKSLQKFAKEHKNEFIEFENIAAKVKKVYDMRSRIVHEGVIDYEEFNDYFDFLKIFVGKLLKLLIFEKIGNYEDF